MVSTPISTTQEGGAATITSVHPDIVRAHILTRLDGPALAAVTCASSQLHTISSDAKLWEDICTSTWPSTDDPRVRQVISTFPSAHRSFFSDSYPLLHHSASSKCNPDRPFTNLKLISAVDIHHNNEPIFSKVHETETQTGWFMSSPFRVDLLDPKESVPTRIRNVGSKHDAAWLKHLEETLTLSWVVIDPVSKRAVNLSSREPVSVHRHWLTGDVQLRFATVVSGGCVGQVEEEMVQFGVVATCGGKEGGDMHVREVSLQVEDMEGKCLNGRDSLVILQRAMEGGVRRKGQKGEVKRWYEEFEGMKRERRERKLRRERALDLVCITIGVSIFIGFWSFILFR